MRHPFNRMTEAQMLSAFRVTGEKDHETRLSLSIALRAFLLIFSLGTK